jgi:hypothetical protein
LNTKLDENYIAFIMIESIEDVETDWVDVMGKGIQTKHVVKNDGNPADMGTIVSCNLTGYFGNDVDHKNAFEALTDQVFVIGEMDTIPAIELTLR